MASSTPAPSSFSAEALRDFLWHDNIDTRKKFLQLVSKDDVWLPKFNLTLPEQRDLAFKRLQLISKAKIFSVKDFASNPRNIFTGTSTFCFSAPKRALFWLPNTCSDVLCLSLHFCLVNLCFSSRGICINVAVTQNFSISQKQEALTLFLPFVVFAAHEMAGTIEGSMATKMTVQWNLFGGTVLKLGTERVRGKKSVNLVPSRSASNAFLSASPSRIFGWY